MSTPESGYIAGMIIKLPGGDERRLTIDEARALHAQLAAIFAPTQIKPAPKLATPTQPNPFINPNVTWNEQGWRQQQFNPIASTSMDFVAKSGEK